MTPRTLLVTLALVSALTACSDDNEKADTVKTGPTPCSSATSTSTDLKTKPVFVVGTCPAPATTTNTDVVVGTGAEAKAGDAVTVQYVGVNYADGKQFDASWDGAGPFQFTVGQGVIPGFTKGVTGMKVGGRRVVVVPPSDGYGDSGPVPGGTLVFLIDLVKVG